MKTTSDMENSWLSGKSKFEAWRKQYMAEITKDDRDLILRTAAQGLVNMPPNVHEYMEQAHPQAWKQVQKLANKKGR